MTHPYVALCLMLALAPLAATSFARGERTERSFERTFRMTGPTTLDVVTNTGRVDVRVGGEGIVVRGTIKRNASWRGVQVTDDAIARLRAAPPIRADGNTVRIERMADEALWRGVAVDYEILVPPTTRVLVATSSGSVSVAGSRDEVRIETGSGAILLQAAAGTADVRSGSGSLRVSGAAASLAMRTQSGSITADVDSVGVLEASSGSGSVTIAGVRGSARVETGSGRIDLDGAPAGDWSVRSRSGSVAIRVPADSGFDLSARSRSGNVKVGLAVSGPNAPSKHSVEGAVNGGGPRLEVETGSSSVTLRP